MRLPSIFNEAQIRRERGLWEAVKFLLGRERRGQWTGPAAKDEIDRLLEEMNYSEQSPNEPGTEPTCESTGRESGEKGKWAASEDHAYRWGEGTLAFDCPCGEREMMVSNQDNDPRPCDGCTRKYRLVHRLEVEG